MTILKKLRAQKSKDVAGLSATSTSLASQKHTPGPWNIEQVFDESLHGDFGLKSETDGKYVCTIWFHGHTPKEANRSLIAAAPELLAALKGLYEETADYIRVNKLGVVHHNRSMQIARDAIAKAEPKSC